MDRFDVERFRSLENSILALRELNRSETLREHIKQANRVRINEYTDEIVNRLIDVHPVKYRFNKKYPEIIY